MHLPFQSPEFVNACLERSFLEGRLDGRGLTREFAQRCCQGKYCHMLFFTSHTRGAREHKHQGPRGRRQSPSLMKLDKVFESLHATCKEKTSSEECWRIIPKTIVQIQSDMFNSDNLSSNVGRKEETGRALGAGPPRDWQHSN